MDLSKKSPLNLLLSFFIYLLLQSSLSECKQRTYHGDKVLRVSVLNEKQWETVQSIMREFTEEDDIWSSPVNLPSFGDIRVSQEEYTIVTSQLSQAGLKFTVFIDNVQDFVDAENKGANTKSKPFRRKRSTMSNHIIGTYATFDEIVKYIYDAEKHFEIATVLQVGESLEGRPLLVLKLGIPHPDPEVVKPVIWIDSTIHAREWIAPASLMYIMYQLLNGYHEKDPVIFDLLKRVDWMFLPVVNPDGYVYSHTDERLWRKNRAIQNGTSCMGVDLNRNFDFHWGEETASADPCHIMYRGVAAASEIETQIVQNFLLEHRSSIYVYISLHSYSQYWFSRWAFTDEKVETHDEMFGLAKRATDALVKVHGTDFQAGRPFELLYGYSGGSADWAYGAAGIPYSYTIELRDKGQYGFLLPVDEIIPQGQELYAGVLVVAEHIKNISKVDFSFLDTYDMDAITPDDVNHFHFKEGEKTSQSPTEEERGSIQDGYARQGRTTAVLMTDMFTSTDMTSQKEYPSFPPSTAKTVTYQVYSTSHNDVTTAKDDFHTPRDLFRNSASFKQTSIVIGLARLGVEEINKVNNEKYRAGLSHELMYGYSGGSPDWVHGVAGIPYSYTIELRDRGQYGFLLPTSHIIPSGEELFAGAMVVGHYIKNVSGIMETFSEEHRQAVEPPKDTSMEDTTESSDNSTRGNYTLPPFVFTETETTTQSPTETTSGGNEDNNRPNNQDKPRRRPIIPQPPIIESLPPGGRGRISCSGPCLSWKESASRRTESRIPRFYRWLYETSGRYGPWRTPNRTLSIWDLY